MSAEALTVVVRHLEAVRGGDPEAMAADYAADAVLERGAASYRGAAAIRRYFEGVADRLGGGHVRFGEPEVDGSQVRFSWRIEGGPADGVSGTDTCTVADGMIARQVVALDDADF